MRTPRALESCKQEIRAIMADLAKNTLAASPPSIMGPRKIQMDECMQQNELHVLVCSDFGEKVLKKSRQCQGEFGQKQKIT